MKATVNIGRHKRLGWGVVFALALGSAAPTSALSSDLQADEDAEEDARADSAAQTEKEIVLPPEIVALINKKEKQSAQIRREGISLLEKHLGDAKSATSAETAEALFKLAELTWEEAQVVYLDKMGAYQAAVEGCHQDRSTCRQVPKRKPGLDLARAQSVYQRLIADYPKFRKIDTVLYLYAFSLRDQGKLEDAVRLFYRILKEHPGSRFRADAWMALGEYRFYQKQDYQGALSAYENVSKFPSSQLHGLALFKSAWCFWKLDKTDQAALRFKAVLDLAEAAKQRSEKEQKRAAELQDQALDYLVELFTEDDTKSAQDAFDFMVQIGGRAYSHRVLKRLADTVFDQTRYERAAEAYLFLLKLDPNGADAPDNQIKVVECFQILGNTKRAAQEMRSLAIEYGPASKWAKANRDRPKTVARASARAAEFIREHAKSVHAAAQKNEKESGVVDKELFAEVADAYGLYLEQFPGGQEAAELQYYRADILYFKLKRYRDAGHEYLRVAKRKPVGEFHKDALLQAMDSFERLRPEAPNTAAEKRKRKVTEEDRLFAEAADLYAEILPDDKDIIKVVYKNGQFFFDYGEYDEAVKRFGLILEKYPDHPLAAEAGDRILQCFGEAKDYENIEHWARRLKKAKTFAGKDEQKRLDDLIVVAMGKSGEALAAEEKYEKAAQRFEAAAAEFPRHDKAADLMFNAGAAYERAGKTEKAVRAYQALAKDHPRSGQAPEALFVAAKLQESVADYSGAVVLFEKVSKDYAKWKDAPVALKNAGILRQSLGHYKRALGHYVAYEKLNRGSAEGIQVAFSQATLRAENNDHRGAAEAFGDFVRRYPKEDKVVEALVKQAESYLAAGNRRGADESLDKALELFKKRGQPEEQTRFAAQARYLQGESLYAAYEDAKIASDPRKLARSLETKANHLNSAKKVYLDVVNYRVPEWATAALYRIGQGYAAYAQAIRDTPTPRGLNGDEQMVYREELDRAVIVIEDKALDAFRAGYSKALEIGVFNTHTKKLRDALAEMDASAFPPEAEKRMGPRLGDTNVALLPLQEIRRD